MPDIDYEWNENNVDIIAKDDIDNISEIKMISSFFESMNIKCISEATVKRIYKAGFTSLIKIFEATQNDFEKIDRFGPKLAEKIYNNIHNGLQNVTLDVLIGSSGLFGIGLGKRKIKALLDVIPDLLYIYKKIPSDELLQKINNIDGFSIITSKKIIDKIETVDNFIKDIEKFVTYKEQIKVDREIICDLDGFTYLFSGFRDKVLEENIISRGGKIITSISKNLSFLIVKDKESDSTKIKKAKELNIPIITKKEI
jgi:DNA ligase (NAD+)